MVKDEVHIIKRLEDLDISFRQNRIDCNSLKSSLGFLHWRCQLLLSWIKEKKFWLEMIKSSMSSRRKLEQKHFKDRVKIIVNQKPMNILANSNRHELI